MKITTYPLVKFIAIVFRYLCVIGIVLGATAVVIGIILGTIAVVFVHPAAAILLILSEFIFYKIYCYIEKQEKQQ